MIRRTNLDGNSNIGVYISVTETQALIPFHTSTRMEEIIEEALEVEVFKATIAGSSLNGILSIGNSNGIIVSPYVLEREIESLEKAGFEVFILPEKFTAVGNLILANDYGALASPLLSDESIKLIEDALEVEVEQGTIAGFNIVGSVAVATNKGVLLHPKATRRELEFVEETLKVPADVGTINHGMTMIGACSIANSNGAIVSEDTTSPEIARIEEALGFL
ncbi:MAG TPA: translation initiation factor IF-6 [Methanothermobacter sp.]|mgnify:CR=1 FL=1|jgi:translation initiation factor 6|uniref:Translation initiation factor 6 n=1 Tax=Methanothermobacter tenebrarum TaxID=680118 RepID=A0ABM7YD06_9EURY|nr:translation initiation factor IF-6 [Methanothermobacter tenebrarum]MDD3454386.1 translation initiation factor IF-6 [Methanobacteriales archaeon]MDX9692872.1 translation initiation factor IF-6 [Methanothermobacter sp.]BDH79984.1 translation initiation factor 6 [Methanothermobacter tenebrarum]HHW16463.1 translation initiation factor IF-6 [Methanothermobacter sp.]HOQ19779.1 translation initiation factor IF-6 [Methanothermobacter sp.]